MAESRPEVRLPALVRQRRRKQSTPLNPVSARPDSARLRASPRSGPRKRLPASSTRGSSIGGKEAEIDVHRLERARAGVDQFDVAAGDVVEERADRRRRRRRRERPAEPLGGGEASGDQADRGALDIALAAGDLAGEAQPWRAP